MRNDLFYGGVVMRWLVFVFILAIQACAFHQPVKDYLSLVEATSFYSIYEHRESGKSNTLKEPLKTIYDQCTIATFEGRTFMFGELVLDDPFMIGKVYHDYHAYLMESVMIWGAKDEKAIKKLVEHIYQSSDYKTLRREAFESSESIEGQLKKITYAIKERDKCLVKQGWIYKKRRAQVPKSSGAEE